MFVEFNEQAQICGERCFEIWKQNEMNNATQQAFCE